MCFNIFVLSKNSNNVLSAAFTGSDIFCTSLPAYRAKNFKQVTNDLFEIPSFTSKITLSSSLINYKLDFYDYVS